MALDLSFAAEIGLRSGENISGISRAALETARALGSRGSVELACVGWSGADPVLSAARVRCWARTVHLPGDATPTKRLGAERAYERLAIGLQGGPAERSASRIALATLKRLATADSARVQNFDVFHSTFMPLPARASHAATARVITVYDLIPFTDPSAASEQQRGMLDAILTSIDVQRDVVIAISEHTKAEFCAALAIESERVVVAQLAAASVFRPASLDRSAAWLPEPVRAGAPYILSVASTQPRKKLGHLVRAFGRLLADQPDSDLQLILTGADTGLGDDVQGVLRAAPSLACRVHRTGFVPDNALAALYAGALVFVMPSRSEGFGLPALEAMQTGAPTVVARAGALPEVVGDGAVVVDPDDIGELVDVLGGLVVDTQLRARLSEAGIARAAHFSWNRCAAATEEAYALALQAAA